MDALGPDLDGFAHGDPHIGVKDIGTLGSLGGVLLKGQGGTGLGGNGLTLCDQGGIRLILLGAQAVKCRPILAQPTIRLLPML